MNAMQVYCKLHRLEEIFERIRTRVIGNIEHDISRYREYERSIYRAYIRTFTFYAWQNGKLHVLREGMPEEHKGRVEEWIEDVSELKGYNPLNFFVALRLYERKRRAIRYAYNELNRQINRLRKEYGTLADWLQGKTDERSMYYLELIYNRNEYLRMLGKVMVEDFPETSFLNQIEGWFQFFRLKKAELLSLITMDYALRHWDGTPNRTRKKIAGLPEELDFDAFQEAVFIEKIEHDQDSYLMDQFMFAVFEAIEKRKVNVTDKFQELFGAVPTYRLELDEFDRVVGMEQNKPNLKRVK